MNSFSIWHLLILVIIPALLYVFYRYASTYKSLIETVGPNYISVSPSMAYLIFIPIIGVVFYAVLAFKLKSALEQLFKDGKITLNTDAVSKSLLAFVACSFLTVIPLVSQFMVLASLICLGFNWSHAVNTRKLILMGATR